MWQELVLAVLLIAAILVHVARVLKRTFEQRRQEKGPAVSVSLPDHPRASHWESRRPSERRGAKRPATDEFAIGHVRRLRIDATAHGMRRGIILMTILEPCRGVNPFRFGG